MSHNIYNLSPQMRAHAVLNVAECTARQAELEFDNAETDGPLLDKCLQSLFSKLKYLKRQVASEYRWSPEFLRIMENAHSIRERRVDYDKKEKLRQRKARCVACGQWESCCNYTLDVLGGFDHAAWFGPSQNIQQTWNEFFNRYDTLSSACAADDLKCLPCDDWGSFALGSVCLRRAILYYQINTLFMERVWNASSVVQAYGDAHGELSEEELITVDEDDVEQFCSLIQTLELACADNKRNGPDLLVDDAMWSAVDDARAALSDGDPDLEAELLQKRAAVVLDAHRRASLERESDKENDPGDDVDWSDEEDEHPDDRPKKPQYDLRRRRRAAVVHSSDGDCEEPHGMARPKAGGGPVRERPQRSQEAGGTQGYNRVQGYNGVQGPGRSQGSKRAREPDSDSVVDDDFDAAQEEEEAPEEVAALCSGSDERQEGPAPTDGIFVRPQARRAQPNAADLARQHRIVDPRLPSDRQALYRLMGLQVELMRERRDKQAAVCTENIFVIQRLLARVEELQHTAE